MKDSKLKYEIGAQVLVRVEPNPGHSSPAFLEGRVTECLGMMDLYDGRVRQSEVNFPVVQHNYRVSLEEGGEVDQFEGRMTRNPQAQTPVSSLD